MLRKTYAAVDLSKIAHNIRVLQRSMGAEERAMAVVKANAYGHGMKEIAKTAQKCGVCWFAVATADEAVALRESCDGNILLLSPADEDSDWALVKNGISVTAFMRCVKLRRNSACARESISKSIREWGALGCAQSRKWRIFWIILMRIGNS